LLGKYDGEKGFINRNRVGMVWESLAALKHIEGQWKIMLRSFRSRLRNKNSVLAFYNALTQVQVSRRQFPQPAQLETLLSPR